METGLRAAAWGCAIIGAAFLYLAVPLGIAGPYASWGLTFYSTAVGMGIAATGLMASSSAGGRRTAIIGFGVGSLAGANLLRIWLVNFAGPGPGALTFLAWLATPALGLGLVGASWPLLGAWRPIPPRDRRIGRRAWVVLPGAAAGAFWFVHDIFEGVGRQLVPDLLLLAGFAAVVVGLRRGPSVLDGSATPPGSP